MNADEIAQLLGLQPHPEGGMYVETWRAPASRPTRRARPERRSTSCSARASGRTGTGSTQPRSGITTRATRCNCRSASDGRSVTSLELGSDLAAGQRPQAIVPPGAWQAARSLGAWTLVGCTVSPGFEFAGFELAPARWEPSGG